MLRPLTRTIIYAGSGLFVDVFAVVIGTPLVIIMHVVYAALAFLRGEDVVCDGRPAACNIMYGCIGVHRFSNNCVISSSGSCRLAIVAFGTAACAPGWVAAVVLRRTVFLSTTGPSFAAHPIVVRRASAYMPTCC